MVRYLSLGRWLYAQVLSSTWTLLSLKHLPKTGHKNPEGLLLHTFGV